MTFSIDVEISLYNLLATGSFLSLLTFVLKYFMIMNV